MSKMGKNTSTGLTFFMTVMTILTVILVCLIDIKNLFVQYVWLRYVGIGIAIVVIAGVILYFIAKKRSVGND